MTAPKPPKIAQLKLRFPETTRKRVAASAKRRGASMNAEIVERIHASLLVEHLLSNAFTLQMQQRFYNYVQVITLGLIRAGEDHESEDLITSYAKHVEFGIDPNDRIACEQAYALIKNAVDQDDSEDRLKVREYLQRFGSILKDQEDKPAGMSYDEFRDFRWRVRNIARREAIKRRRTSNAHDE